MYFEGAFARQPNHIGAAIFIKQFQKHYINQLTGAEFFNPNQGYSEAERLFFLNNYFFTNNNYLNQLLTKNQIPVQQQVQKSEQLTSFNNNLISQQQFKTTEKAENDEYMPNQNIDDSKITSIVEQINLKKLNNMNNEENNKPNIFTTTSIKQDLKDKDQYSINNTTESQAQTVNNVIDKLRSLTSKGQTSLNIKFKSDGK